MLVFEQGMQQKLTDSWKNVYNSEISVMAEDGLDTSPSLADDISGDRKTLVNGLLKRANGFSDVMGSGGLEQKIQELRAEKEAAEFKKCPGVSETDDQDSPIDFSVKRRSSFSGSLTDDSMSSSTSPNPMTDYANNASPPLADRELHRHGFDNLQVKREPEQSFSNGHVVNDGTDFIKAHDTSSPGGLEDMKPGLVENPSSLMPPGTSIPPLLNNLGMFSGLPANLLSNGSAMNAFSQLAASAAFIDPRNKKANRPFKAYPKEALQMPLGFFGLPGMTPALLQQGLDSGLFGGANGEEVMNLYNQQLQLLREKQLSTGQLDKRSPPTNVPTGHKSPSHNLIGSQQQRQQILSSHPQALNNHRLSSSPSSQTHDDTNHHADSSPMLSNTISQCAPSSTSSNPPMFPLPTVLPPTSTNCPSSNSSGTTIVSSTSPSYASFNTRKRPRTLPEEQKDSAYWERRRKNNDAAKRSRDARRAKEDEIAIRAALLEQENLKLRVEVAALKTETARLRCLLYNS